MDKSEKSEVAKRMVKIGRLLQETDYNTLYKNFYATYNIELAKYVDGTSSRGLRPILALKRYKYTIDSVIDTNYNGNILLKYLSDSMYLSYSKGIPPEYLSIIEKLALGYNQFVLSMNYALSMPRTSFRKCIKYSEKMLKKSGIDKLTISFFIDNMTNNYTSK